MGNKSVSVFLLDRVKTMHLKKTKVYRSIIDKIRSVRENKINQWYGNKKLFFIVAVGRSGTKWLSHILDLIDATVVTHEPALEDTKAHKDICDNPKVGMAYMHFRRREIYHRCKALPVFSNYGEVNGNLRRHIEPISELFHDVTLIHLVRDGRDVVRSIMSRSFLTKSHPVYDETYIQPTDELSAVEWFRLSRFEKICWVWKAENQFIRSHCAMYARLEDITSSYSLFKSQILDVIGLDLEEDVWQREVNLPLNTTPRHAMSSWDGWDINQKAQFIRICGEEMEKYEYTLS